MFKMKEKVTNLNKSSSQVRRSLLYFSFLIQRTLVRVSSTLHAKLVYLYFRIRINTSYSSKSAEV